MNLLVLELDLGGRRLGQSVLLDALSDLVGTLHTEANATQIQAQLLLGIVALPEAFVRLNEGLIFLPTPQRDVLLLLLRELHIIVLLLLLGGLLDGLLRVVHQDLIFGVRVGEPEQRLHAQ